MGEDQSVRADDSTEPEGIDGVRTLAYVRFCISSMQQTVFCAVL